MIPFCGALELVIMDAHALAVEVQALSAYHSIDTLVNLYPGNASGNNDGTLPTLSPAVLAFLAAHHEASQVLLHRVLTPS